MGTRQSSLLKNVVIAKPCSVSWNSMTGDDTKRVCSGCSKNVYNLSSMTSKEAEKFLAENGYSHCMTFYRRTDGTIMSDECPRALRKLRDGYRAWKTVMAGLFAFVLSYGVARAQSRTDPYPMVAGGITAPKNYYDPKVENDSNNPAMETRAHDLFQQGQLVDEQGDKQMAEYYYRQALNAFDAQKAPSDPQFRQMIEEAIANLDRPQVIGKALPLSK